MLKAASNSAGRRRQASPLQFRIRRRRTTTVSTELRFLVCAEKGAGPKRQGSSASSESVDARVARQMPGASPKRERLNVRAQSERHSGDCIVEP